MEVFCYCFRMGISSDATIRTLTKQLNEARALINSQAEQIKALIQRITQLENDLAKAQKNSSNSSKPPSSDIVNPQKAAKRNRKRKRKRGGQKGHPRHDRPSFPFESLDNAWEYTLESCPLCGVTLEDAERAPRVVQQVEIIDVPVRIEEHRGRAYWCPSCQKFHYAPLPPEVEQGQLFGPRLTTLVAYMKGVCHASFSTIRKFIRDVIGIKVSRGYLRKLIGKMSEALKPSYDELLGALPNENTLNIDETGHKENGERFWTWCFRAEMYTLFRIDKSRGSKVLIDVLGEEFNGVIGCDYWGAYKKYMRLHENVQLQFCIAHLIRDVKYLATLSDKATKAYGKRLREALRQLFRVIHRREEVLPRTFERRLSAARDRIFATATGRVPSSSEAQNMADRFVKHGKSYFRFITTPGIGPTNNLAEQAIRFVVIDRRITQGTRNESGRHWCERIWTTIATCTQCGLNVFEFLRQSLLSHWMGSSWPSLLFDSG
jgi:transposase